MFIIITYCALIFNPFSQFGNSGTFGSPVVYMCAAIFVFKCGGADFFVIGKKLNKQIFFAVAELCGNLLNAHIGGEQQILGKLNSSRCQILLKAHTVIFLKYLPR